MQAFGDILLGLTDRSLSPDYDVSGIWETRMKSQRVGLSHSIHLQTQVIKSDLIIKAEWRRFVNALSKNRNIVSVWVLAFSAMLTRKN